MDDPYRQPKGADRAPLEQRVRRAADDGRISAADRDIRLGNLASAQSMAELDLIRRDLDQLEATLSPGTSAPLPPVAAPGPAAPVPSPTPSGSGGGRRAGVVVAVVAVLAVLGAGVAGLLVFSSTGGSSGTSTGTLQEPVPITTEPADQPADPEEPVAPAGPAYALTGPGIRAFLAAYRAKFGTSRVTSLTMYDDYVVVQVPVPGKHRHAGWVYRPGQGWSDFGGVSADFPGSAPVDTRTIAVPALVRNIARARRTLDVEDYSLTYVNVDHRPQFDDGPNVNIYVSNEFHESGYLATRPDGSVERAYPFAG